MRKRLGGHADRAHFTGKNEADEDAPAFGSRTRIWVPWPLFWCLPLLLLSVGCQSSADAGEPRLPVDTASTGRSQLDPPGSSAIVINTPRSGELIRNPVRVSGTARVQQSSLRIEIYDALGASLGSTNAPLAGLPGQRSTFAIDVNFLPPAGSQSGMIEVYALDEKSGVRPFSNRIGIVLASR